MQLKYTGNTEQELVRFKESMDLELSRILDYWVEYAPDYTHGGFIGSVDRENTRLLHADKGVVLNTRILWTFSVMYRRSRDDQYLKLARRARDYIEKHFIDKQHGGVYSTLTYKGIPASDKKQMYCQAFAIYGLSEYYLASGDPASLQMARELFYLVEKHSLDKQYGGYMEAFSNNWEPVTDYRLSDKDDNYPKTMNTHLHLLEAYTNFYKAVQEPGVRDTLEQLLLLFPRYIIQDSGHLELYFDMDWTPSGKYVSYGHDIEAAWLMNDALSVMDLKEDRPYVRDKAFLLADTFRNDGIDRDGGVLNEFSLEDRTLDTEKHHWPQAEAMVGLFDAYELTGKPKFLRDSLRVYEYVKRYFIDSAGGEWYLRIDQDGRELGDEKIGYWKCPYHNARACMELSDRIERVLELAQVSR